MKLQACFPCVLAFGILLPLVALSFVTWFLFYDRAVDLAQESGDFYLNRITAIMSERIQEVLVRTDNIAFTARTSLANFLPWALIPNATIVDKPNLLMHLNLLTDLTPSYVYGVVCATEGGVAFTILQRARDQWSFFLIQDGLTTAPQMIRFYLNTSDPIALAKALFKSNATWLDIRDHPNIVIDSTPALFLYRSRDWYVEARTKYAEGIYSGWSKSYPIIGGLYGGGLGMAAWFGLSGDSETPFVGMCHSQLFLGDLHTVLSANKLGVNGLAILTDASGIVIATSRDMDAGGGVGRTGVPTNICDVADFTTPCLRLQELLATQTPDILVPSTAAAAAAKPFASTSVELRTSTFDGDVRYSVFSIRARAFSGYLVFVGRAADFNGGIDHDRNVAVVVSVAVLLVVSSCVAFVTYLFSRPLSVVSSMLREISHVSSEHSRKLEQDGVLQSLPDREWERITRLVDSYVSATPTDDAPVGRPRSRCHPWTKCCDRMMVGRWGGPELKQLQGSLLTMVDSLSNLARKATEQEVLRRKFIRYIFHEVRVPLHSMALALAQLPPHVLEGESCRIVQEQCTAVTDLLTDVLTLDKMEQGQFELDLKPTCLDCLVRSTARLFIPTAEALGLAFEIVIEDSDVPMQAKDYLSSEHGTTNANGNDNDTKDEHVSAPSTEQKSSPSQLSSGSRRKLRDGYDRSSLSSLLTLPSPSPTNRTLQTVRSSSGSACVHPFSYKVLVDPTRLRQILRNLLSNAFKFTKRGTVQIELWCSDGSALISVADTGIGIDEAAQERLFRPYVQFANEMQQGQGSGLGLSISKRLTLLHGGDLTCKSEAGLGSTFTVQIPLIAATSETRPSPSITSRAINRGTSSPTDTAVVPTSTARLMDACARSLDRLHSEGSIEMQSPIAQNIRRFVDARLTAAALPTVKPAATTTPPSTDDALSPPRPTSENTPAAASHPSIDTASSAQKRALVVDDSVLNVKLLCRLLELRGWSAIGAEDGAVACELVDDRSTEHAFHVIFMDRNMPVMDGLQATRELRARGFSGCIIGLTGDVSTESVRELNSAGVDLVMPKPFDVKKLDEVLQQLSLPTA